MAKKNYIILKVMTHDLGIPGASFELIAGGTYTLEEAAGALLVAAGKAKAAPEPEQES